MTVKELIKLLQKEDPNRLVVCQRDPEGNGFSPFADCWPGVYVAESEYYGECGLETLTDELREQGFTEEDVAEDGVPALFLVPMN